MIRPARFAEVMELVGLLVEQHPETIYADKGEVDIDYARKLLAQMIHRHGGIHNGGTCVFVVENGKGVIRGFVAGQLSPVYHIGTRLMAQDVFLVVRPGAPNLAGVRLMRAYMEWAKKSPKILEIDASHMDLVPESERVGEMFERMGFQRCGAVFRMFVNDNVARIAA